jgi:hypothetical protein
MGEDVVEDAETARAHYVSVPKSSLRAVRGLELGDDEMERKYRGRRVSRLDVLNDFPSNTDVDDQDENGGDFSEDLISDNDIEVDGSDNGSSDEDENFNDSDGATSESDGATSESDGATSESDGGTSDSDGGSCGGDETALQQQLKQLAVDERYLLKISVLSYTLIEI